MSDPGNSNGVTGPIRREITGVILAGGLGRRMGEQDKGLLPLEGRPLVVHVIDVLRPQVGRLIISANRNLDRYRALGLPVVEDMVGEFFGPLVGMASAMRDASSPLVLAVPCDAPSVPADLCARLYRQMRATGADISVAHDGTRMQPVFALLRRDLLSDLLEYLNKGGRKIDTWYAKHRLVLTDFSDRPDAFLNINTPQELIAAESAKGVG